MPTSGEEGEMVHAMEMVGAERSRGREGGGDVNVARGVDWARVRVGRRKRRAGGRMLVVVVVVAMENGKWCWSRQSLGRPWVQSPNNSGGPRPFDGAVHPRDGDLFGSKVVFMLLRHPVDATLGSGDRVRCLSSVVGGPLFAGSGNGLPCQGLSTRGSIGPARWRQGRVMEDLEHG